jgi:hypothetical protein
MKEPTDTSGGFFGEDGKVTGWTLETLNEELASTDDDDLEASIVEMKQRMDALHGEWLLRIAEYDRRQIADIRHRLSTTGWLRSTLRLTGRVASDIAHRARGLAQMPDIADAVAVGDVGTDALRLLDRARHRHPVEFSDHEAVFAEVAAYLDPSELRQVVAHWEQQIDFPSAVAQMRNQRHRRRFSINQEFDGMWALTGALDTEIGSIVDHAIATAVNAAYLDDDDRRAPWQIRADALGDICEQFLRHNTTATSGGVKPHVTVDIAADVLLGLRNGFGAVGDVGVPPETIDRIVCDSSIVRILTDTDGKPINVGRATRTIPTGLRRVLDARDRGCQWAGCDAPVDWCDAHHIKHWADGGETNLDNLILLCRTHHTATHEDTARSRHRTARHRARAP